MWNTAYLNKSEGIGEGKKSARLMWINHVYNPGLAACDTWTAAPWKCTEEEGERSNAYNKKRQGQKRNVARTQRKGEEETKKEFNYPTQLWTSKHTGGHRVACVTNTHNKIQHRQKHEKILSHSVWTVSYYSPLPLEALHPPSHPPPGIQINPQ